jgi:hypothetical protein
MLLMTREMNQNTFSKGMTITDRTKSSVMMNRIAARTIEIKIGMMGWVSFELSIRL